MSAYEDKDLRHKMDFYFMQHQTIDGFDTTNVRKQNMATNTARSEFIGVYATNPEADYAQEVPFRVALPVRKEGEDTTWIYGGFFKTDKTAARAYNMLAIEHFGKDAIVNDIGKPTKAHNDEFAQYISGNPARAQKYRLTADKAKQLIAEYGAFKTHKDVRKAAPQAPEVDGVL